MQDVARDHRPGHTGNTPQDASGIIAQGRIAGMLADFTQHLEPDPVVAGYMGYPNIIAEPGYFRDDTVAIQLMDASNGLDQHKPTPTGKTVGGYDPGGLLAVFD